MGTEVDMIENWAVALRQRGDVVSASAPDIGTALVTEVKRTASAGQTPDGTPWPATADGGAPLKNAAAAITHDVTGVGARSVVRLIVRGRHALHDQGKAQGAPRRQILPRSMNERLRNAVADTIRRHWGHG